MRKLYAFSGVIASGKTTAARYLESEYGFVLLSFGNKLKEIVSLITPDNKINKARDRKLLEFVGTNYYRNMDPDHWIIYVVNKIHHAWLEEKDVVIDDLRFKNEASVIMGLGGKLLQINTHSKISEERQISRDHSRCITNHEAEKFTPESHTISHSFSNNGNLEEFQRDLKLYFS